MHRKSKAITGLVTDMMTNASTHDCLYISVVCDNALDNENRC
ncbi:MAG: hypothetical protein QXH20_03520 [Candidatus Bathyarchaeia archaeon]